MSTVRAPALWLCVGLALLFLGNCWGPIAHSLSLWNHSGEMVRTEVSVWSTSSDPEREQQIARRFSQHVENAAVSIRFRESSTVGEAIYVSFLSGNPPDVMDIPLNQLDESVSSGLIRPMDDLLEQALADDPDFLERRLGGALELVRYQASPHHPIIRAWAERGERELEAARMLAMHGRVVGFAGLGPADTLTWNRRLVARAGEMFPDLLDENGEPRPPETWAELRQHAQWVSEWSRQTFAPDASDRPYGMVVQGQRPRDLWRGIGPLAATAGAMGFDFSRGQWDWAQPGIIGAYTLFLKLQNDGSVLPGTGGRDYEEPRTLLAQGRAAYLIDGFWAANRGAITVPERVEDIASAPLPVPWRNAAEREEITTMLGLDDLPLGQPMRQMGTRVSVLTTGLRDQRDAEVAWQWMHRNQVRDEQLDGIVNHFSQPTTRDVAQWIYHSDDPEAVQLRQQMPRFQSEVWEAMTRGQAWPTNPGHGPVAGADEPAVAMHGAYLASEGRHLDDQHFAEHLQAIINALQTFTDATNRDLERRVEQGIVDPQAFAIPDWDPQRSADAFAWQRQFVRPEDQALLAALQERLPEHLDQPWFIQHRRGWLHIVGVACVMLLMALTALVVIWRRHLAIRPEERQAFRREVVATRYGWYFAAPMLLLAAVFVIWPAISMVWLSFFTGTGQGSLQWSGAEQYARLLGDGTFWGEVLPNSLIYMFVVAGAEVAIGLSIALLLNLSLRAGGLYRTLIFIPMVTSMAVVSIVFFGILAGRDSGINNMIAGVGLEWLITDSDGVRIDWLNDERVRILGIPAPLWSVMMVAIWSGLPSVVILCLAGLQSVPKDLYEAAKVDGAGPWTRFWRITIPGILPLLLIIVFNSLVNAARHFGTVYIMTGGYHGTEIASTYIYKWGFQRTDNQVPDLGYAAALGVAYMGILLVIASGNLWVVMRRWKARLGGGQ
ncbi:MAG: ABC transporter permease subunit [Planctomycetota bacterium]|nr:MAG: ABC transporter permease subunit [Planctomycetota bacterium]